MRKDNKSQALNRRDFLRGGSLGAMMAMMGGVAMKKVQAQEAKKADEIVIGEPIKTAVIGCGPWGREILNRLSRLPNAEVAAVCDHYEPFLRRGKNAAPKAESYTDYKKVLEQKDIKAVIVATPTHRHKDIVIEALKAGKHVYCEAPLAHTVEDARAIAQAAQAAKKQYFQAGLQRRADPEVDDIVDFVRAGAMGTNVLARSQWHKKQSWRVASPNAEREKEANWRLDSATSPGLIGEIGIHQIDQAALFFRALPVAVSGFGSTLHWRDGRTAPDTVQAIIEFPRGLRMVYDATLANSFDGEHDVFYGTDAAIMIRDRRSWMFREVDSPLLGWEVYAKKETFHKETGIVLAANATKLAAQGETASQDTLTATQDALYYALQAFTINADLVGTSVEDFIASFGDSDMAALQDVLDGLKTTKKKAAGYQEGYEATVLALKANEAVTKGQRIALDKELFEIG